MESKGSGRDLLDHGGALERDAPAVDVHVVGEAHGLEHLGAEHPAVADLDPFVEERVEREDLERGLFSHIYQYTQTTMRKTRVRCAPPCRGYTQA